MKKIELAQNFITDNLDLFKCPICGNGFVELVNHSMVCVNQHNFDISKKGTVYFLQKQFKAEYDTAMLNSRRNILQAGLFDPIIEFINDKLDDKKETILDVGCGEGTPLAKLLNLRNNQDIGIGFDISKDGINLATNQNTKAFFCVADLARLPFTDRSFSTIVDLFSPSAYEEFNRVIKPGGKLIKIVPNSDYLKELRELLYDVDNSNRHYSNQKVVDLFAQHYPVFEQTELSYQFKIPMGLQHDLMIMTPLHWGKGQKELQPEALNQLTKITVSVTVLIKKY